MNAPTCRHRVATAIGTLGAAVLVAPLAAYVLFHLLQSAGPASPHAVPPLPARLSGTGLYADPARHLVAEENRPFSPQYPLWTDGAAKRRWIHVPPGQSIDASDPDAWRFPVGTKVWKEFAFERRVETRLIEHAPEGWRFATYQWEPDGSDAWLVEPEGVRGAHEIRPGVRHDLPGRLDCLACHTSSQSPILGFSALQLSAARDPLAPNATAPEPGSLDLPTLLAEGLVRGLPPAIDASTLAIPAATPRERAVRGWLHANCAMCHNAEGPLAGLDMALPFRVAPTGASRTLADLVGQPSRFHPRGLPGPEALRVVPGSPEASVLYRRIASRQPSEQMPPLGTHLVDEEARALIEAWIREDLGPSAPPATARAASVPVAPPDAAASPAPVTASLPSKE